MVLIMGETKRIVCLANSRKPDGRCVAGVELTERGYGAWVRPVSRREGHAVSEYERQYLDGSDPHLLDVIDVPLLAWQPNTYQQENWLIDRRRSWEKVGQLSPTDVAGLPLARGPLWLNGRSTYNGQNDEVGEEDAQSLRSSLALVHVRSVRLRAWAPKASFGDERRRLQANFEHGGVRYRLWVTDPVFERRYLALPDGQHSLGPSYLTISLGEAYKGACHKLVAAIIEAPTGAGGGLT
jgi:hypothetical protein